MTTYKHSWTWIAFPIAINFLISRNSSTLKYYLLQSRNTVLTNPCHMHKDIVKRKAILIICIYVYYDRYTCIYVYLLVVHVCLNMEGGTKLLQIKVI
jgi:hypothetical protein